MATYNVNTSGFTPAQLTAFNSAASLAAPGNTVTATGSQTPGATAAASGVKNPAAPTTNAQSTYIQSQATAAAPTLTQQLLAGKPQTTPAPTSVVPTSLYDINSNGNNTNTSSSAPQPTTNNAQSVNGAYVNQQSPTSLTTMYKADGTPIQIDSNNIALNTYNASTNPNGYYASNPTAANPNTSTTGSPSTTPTGAGNATSAGILGSMSPAQSAAYQQAQTINTELEQSRQNEANTVAGINTQPIPLEFQQGQAQVVQGQYQSQQNALAQQENAQVSLIGALSPSNTTQQVGAGTTVLGGNGQPIASTPTITTPGQAQYVSPPVTYTNGQPNPTTGPAPSAYTVQSGDTLSAIAAQKGVSLQDLEAANPQITNFNQIMPGQQINLPSSSGGTSSSTGPGGTGGSAFTAGQVQGNQALGAQYAQNISANNQAKAIKSQIVSYIDSNPQLNPAVFTDANALIQLMSGKVSNPQYQILSNDLSEYVNTLTPILGVGGDSTNLKTEIAQGFVSAVQSGKSITTVLDGIEQLADAKLAVQANGGNSVAPPNTTSGTTPNGSSSNGTISAGGYTFTQVNGQWVAQ